MTFNFSLSILPNFFSVFAEGVFGTFRQSAEGADGDAEFAACAEFVNFYRAIGKLMDRRAVDTQADAAGLAFITFIRAAAGRWCGR